MNTLNPIKPARRAVEVIETYYRDGTMRSVVKGAFRTCVVKGSDEDGWMRVTQNRSIHGRRYELFASYDSAVAASIAWGNRKEAA